MHVGVRARLYHFNVSLYTWPGSADAGARVQVRWTLGAGTQTKVLEPMAINDTASYGNYLRLRAHKPYRFTVRVQKAGYATFTEAKFEPWTD